MRWFWIMMLMVGYATAEVGEYSGGDIVAHEYIFVLEPDTERLANLEEVLDRHGFTLEDESVAEIGFGGKLWPLDAPIEVSLRAYETSIYPGIGTEGRGSFFLNATGLTNPCNGLLARVSDQQQRSVHEALQALKKLETLEEFEDIIAYGPDPQTVPSTGLYQGVSSTHNFEAPIGFPGESEGIVIAVLDTGVYYHHELEGRLYGGFDFVDPGSSPDDVFDEGGVKVGHGTPVAVLAAGETLGLASGAQILPVRVCSQDEEGQGHCLMSHIVKGVCYALTNAPVEPEQLVLNLSLGGSTPVSVLEAILGFALSQGSLVVASGGNEGQSGSPRHFPAAHPLLGLMAVAALDMNGHPAPFTTRGDYLDVATQGVEVTSGSADLAHSPWPHYQGTSFAAPQVAGALAVLRGVLPGLSPGELEGCFKDAVAAIDPLDPLEEIGVGGFDVQAFADVRQHVEQCAGAYR